MSITIGTNLASLRAQRQLFATEQQLSTVFERLSSGQRINRASDDAAGLAVSSALNNDKRVLTQAVRNVSDGISLLNIADGALTQLSDILIRQQELAEQAANGTFGREQRVALQREYDQLTSEYNRILTTTEFNGLSLYDSLSSSVTLQVGKNSSDVLEAAVGEELQRNIGTGQFTSGQSIAGLPTDTVAADLNSDGNLDLIVERGSSTNMSVLLGNGDGTFGDPSDITFTSGTDDSGLMDTADMNGDGILDIIRYSGAANMVLETMLGNGDGTFQSSVSTDTGQQSSFGNTSIDALEMTDLNGDGVPDAITVSEVGIDDTRLRVSFGNEDGSFSPYQEVAQSSAQDLRIELADFNGDGADDIFSPDLVRILLNDGSGSFSTSMSLPLFSFPDSVTVLDLNRDGNTDMVSIMPFVQEGIVQLGNGDGTFQSPSTFDSPVIGFGTNLTSVDLNNDGIEDLLMERGGQNFFMAGTVEGTFQAAVTVTGTTLPSVESSQNWFADLNNDGVLDQFLTSSDSVVLQQTEETTNIKYDSVLSQSEARETLDLLHERLSALSRERGSIGATQSRLQITSSTLRSQVGVLAQAESRILDADMASETAKLTRLNILQQASAAVLSQANLQPSLALSLLQ